MVEMCLNNWSKTGSFHLTSAQEDNVGSEEVGEGSCSEGRGRASSKVQYGKVDLRLGVHSGWRAEE